MDVQIVMYTRKGCHLCEDAWQTLEEARRAYGFGLEAVDVDSSADLVARYGDWVPVVTVNGKVRFRGGVSRPLLMRILDAHTR